MGDCASLSYLDAATNCITYLPASFGALSALQYCNLENNEIVTSPHIFSHLSNLKYLNMRTNAARELPPDLGNMATLTLLDLSCKTYTLCTLYSPYIYPTFTLHLPYIYPTFALYLPSSLYASQLPLRSAHRGRNAPTSARAAPAPEPNRLPGKCPNYAKYVFLSIEGTKSGLFTYTIGLFAITLYLIRTPLSRLNWAPVRCCRSWRCPITTSVAVCPTRWVRQCTLYLHYNIPLLFLYPISALFPLFTLYSPYTLLYSPSIYPIPSIHPLFTHYLILSSQFTLYTLCPV
jgi:hypothetical protein